MILKQASVMAESEGAAMPAEPESPLLPSGADALPTLTIAIATIGKRVAEINPAALVAHDGIHFLVVVQDQPAIEADSVLDAHVAALVSLPHVTVVKTPETGLSKSRNMAIDLTESDLLLIADDDITFNWPGIGKMRAWFAANPDSALAWGRSRRPETSNRRPYPAHGKQLSLWNCGRVISPELAVRIASIRERQLSFDANFGLGTAQNLGEEYIFVTDCLKAGLRANHIDVILCSHPHDSSAAGWSKPEMARARAAIFTRVFGHWAPLVRIAYVLRSPDKFHGIGHALRFIAG